MLNTTTQIEKKQKLDGLEYNYYCNYVIREKIVEMSMIQSNLKFN